MRPEGRREQETTVRYGGRGLPAEGTASPMPWEGQCWRVWECQEGRGRGGNNGGPLLMCHPGAGQRTVAGWGLTAPHGSSLSTCGRLRQVHLTYHTAVPWGCCLGGGLRWEEWHWVLGRPGRHERRGLCLAMREGHSGCSTHLNIFSHPPSLPLPLLNLQTLVYLF